MIITIDGPAGSGKSTLALLIAKELGFLCINSGYLYRGVAYILTTSYGYDKKSLQAVNIQDVKAIFQSGNFVYQYEYGLPKIIWAGVDITLFLKSIECSDFAAIIAQDKEVRLVVRGYKRQLAGDRDIVIEGRVCGSVVFPQADIKFFVTASLEVRAQRFYQDQIARGVELTREQAYEAVVARDHADLTRLYDPLVEPVGAIVLDTSELSIQQALQKALNVIKGYMHKCKA